MSPRERFPSAALKHIINTSDDNDGSIITYCGLTDMAPKLPGSGGNGSHVEKEKGSLRQSGPEPSLELLRGDREEGTGQASDLAGVRGEVDTGCRLIQDEHPSSFQLGEQNIRPGSPSGMREMIHRRLLMAIHDGRAERSSAQARVTACLSCVW